jgi:hypothetical protein
MHRPLTSLLVFVLAGGCSAAPAPTSPASQARATSPDILFQIRLAGSQPLVALTGVEVTLVAADGRLVPIAKSVDGYARVSKNAIRELKATVVLFCRQGTFCGAVMVSQGQFSLLEYDEFFVQLAPFAVV